MAEGDIYRLTLNYEGPQRAAQTAIYYQEVDGSTGPIGAVKSLNESFAFSMLSLFANVLSEEWHIPSTRAERIVGTPLPPDLLTLSERQGGRLGRPLPSNNCLLIQLLQSRFPRTSNGRFYLPGLSEDDSVIGIVDSAFMQNQVLPLTNALAQPLNEQVGTGQWMAGVISAKVRDAGPEKPDYAAAFSELIQAIGNPVIARQRRRTTRVVGQSGI